MCGFSFRILILVFVSHQAVASRPYIETKTVIVGAGEVHQGVRFPKGTELTLIAKSNAVASVLLHQDFAISGHLIKRGTRIEIWDNGTLFSIETQADQKISDLVFSEREASIRFSREGKLETIHLKNPKNIRGLVFEKNHHVEFHPNGIVSRGTLANDQHYAGLNLKALSEIKLFSSGKIQQAKLGKDSRWGDLILKADSHFGNQGETEFWPNGKLKTAVLAQTAQIQNLLCGAGPISFFESGKLKTAIVADNRRITLNSYPGQASTEMEVKVGDQLTLSEDGRFVGWGSRR